MKLDLALRELHRSERSLASDLAKVADRHEAEHEVHHVALDLARWSRQHVHDLAGIGPRYGLDLADDAEDDDRHDTGLMTAVRSKLSEWTGRHPAPGVVLLADLRHLHRTAAGVSLDWELLAQGAQAAREADLLDLAERCHPQTLRQVRWANAMLKTLSPQVLTS
ncbi:hypothetical protein [Saccharothrix sp. HUAS TT1]|uniref:hypothetical protein n=1 Tax=unclassified Saccharothrix TaxID=2593673 RepID=UPI00345B56B0